MIDAKITQDGDIDLSGGTGDITLTGYSAAPNDMEDAVCLSQMARMALMTEKEDFLIQPTLGNTLMSLIGLPNKPSTAATGGQIIKDALQTWGITNKVRIETWPVDLVTIGYEVKIELTPGGRELTFTLEQGLEAFNTD